MATNKNEKRDVKKHFDDVNNTLIEYISVKDFVKGFKNRSSNDARLLYIEAKLAVKDYEKYEVVGVVCDQIVVNSYFTQDGQFKVDSCKKYVLYVVSLIETYTNLMFDKTDVMADFNAMQRYGLVDAVIGYIPEDQVAIFDSVLNMKSNDVMTNYYEPHAFVREQVVKFAPLIHRWIESFLGAAEGVLDEVDMDKVREMVTKK